MVVYIVEKLLADQLSMVLAIMHKFKAVTKAAKCRYGQTIKR